MYVNPLYLGIAIGVVGTIVVEVAALVTYAVCSKKK